MASALAENTVTGTTRLRGRIDYVRSITSRGQRAFRVLLKLPAPDEFSSPSTVEIRSLERFGNVGEDVSVICEVGGFPRSFEAKGDEGGTVRTAENVLTFVSLA